MTKALDSILVGRSSADIRFVSMGAEIGSGWDQVRGG